MDKLTEILILMGVVFLCVFIVGLVGLDQKTDARIERMIKAGTDPGKAYCAMRMDQRNGCAIILGK